MKANRLSKTKGQSTVEFAFAIVFFIGFMLTIADIARICYTWAGLQFAVNEGARWGSVQNGISSTTDLKNKIIAKGQELRVTINSNDITIYYPAGSRTSLGYFTVAATSTVTLTPFSGLLLSVAGNHSGTYRVAAETLIRNENF